MSGLARVLPGRRTVLPVFGAVVAVLSFGDHPVPRPPGRRAVRLLVLAVAVTVIEVALIVTLMVGALPRGTAQFNAEGSATALATVATVVTLGLVLPRFATSHPGSVYSPRS